MFATYLVVTLLASALNGMAAVANFIGHDHPRSQADKMGVPRSWMLPLGTLLAAGSLGLLAGFAVPLPADSCCTSSAPSVRTCGFATTTSAPGPCSSPWRWPPWP